MSHGVYNSWSFGAFEVLALRRHIHHAISLTEATQGGGIAPHPYMPLKSWRGIGTSPMCQRWIDGRSGMGALPPFATSSYVLCGAGIRGVSPLAIPCGSAALCVSPTCSHHPCAHTGPAPDKHSTDKHRQTNKHPTRQTDRQ